MRGARDKFILGEARYAKSRDRVAKQKVARVRTTLDGETYAMMKLCHHVIIHEGGVMRGDLGNCTVPEMSNVCDSWSESGTHLHRRWRRDLNLVDERVDGRQE